MKQEELKLNNNNIDQFIKSIALLELDEKISAINQIREKIHFISPFKNEPVDFVKWVKNDWRTKDIWIYNKKAQKCYNHIYDLMHQAGVPLSQQRLCQPYGDDQKKGLWLYHILEPQSWFMVVSRVNGANSGSLYINETGNINGVNKINLPPGHTYKSFCNLLLSTLPEISRNHFIERFKDHIKGWRKRGYNTEIPDLAPRDLENKHWVPSWRRLCKVLLRNDWWCKGLGMTQPKSEAYGRYLKIKKAKRHDSLA